MTKREIEIFSAGCPLCKETEEMVNKLACQSCSVSVVDMQSPAGVRRAKDLGVSRVPSVAVNGTLADCCAGRGPDAKRLSEMGLGVFIG